MEGAFPFKSTHPLTALGRGQGVGNGLPPIEPEGKLNWILGLGGLSASYSEEAKNGFTIAILCIV